MFLRLPFYRCIETLGSRQDDINVEMMIAEVETTGNIQAACEKEDMLEISKQHRTTDGHDQLGITEVICLQS